MQTLATFATNRYLECSASHFMSYFVRLLAWLAGLSFLACELHLSANLNPYLLFISHQKFYFRNSSYAGRHLTVAAVALIAVELLLRTDWCQIQFRL